MNHIMWLPLDIRNIILEYVPLKEKWTVYKQIYIDNHSFFMKQRINNCNFDSYIRYVIRNDYYFIFEQLLKNNHSKWRKLNRYNYKCKSFINYYTFLVHYCIENESTQCRNIITTIQNKNKIK
jgi:hypothetical protein